MIGGGKGQPGVEVVLGRGPFADDHRGDAAVALDVIGDRPSDRLRVLGGEVARHGEEPDLSRRVESGQLATAEPVLGVGEDLVEHVDHRPARGDQPPLVPVGGEEHVAGAEFVGVADGEGLLAGDMA